MIKVAYSDRRLERMAKERRGDGTYPINIVKAFLKCVDLIRASPDTNTLRSFKSRRLEKLKGHRKHQHSMRLNDQWRLILEITDGENKTHEGKMSFEDAMRFCEAAKECPNKYELWALARESGLWPVHSM